MIRSSLAAAIAAALLLPSGAHAATVSLSGGSLHVDETAGTQDNTITIDYTGGAWTVHEAAISPLTIGSGCAPNGPSDATCTTGGPVQVFVSDAGGTNSYTMLANFPSAMDGGSGADALTGGPSSDALRGHGGADILSGGAGTNTLQGGAGGDTFSGGSGASDYTTVDYADGEHFTAVTVMLDGAANDGGIDDGGADNVGASVNEVDGTSLADNITGGGAKTHTLYGAGGDDTVTAQSNASGLGDELAGGSGNDTLIGGPAFDRVSYGYISSGSGVTATLGSGGGRTGDTDTYSGTIEELDGSQFADTLTGTAGNDYLKGHGGDDTLSGLGGSDRLYGDADIIFFAPSSDNDTLTGGAGNDRLVGNEGDDTLHLDDGEADTLGSDCDGALPSGASAGADDAYSSDASDVVANCERSLNAGGGGGTPPGNTPPPSGGGGATTPGKPVNTDLPQVVSLKSGTGPFRLNADLTCNPGDWTPVPYSISGYAWFRYPNSTSSQGAPVKVADGQDYTVVPADQGNRLACAATAKNAAGSTATLSPRVTVFQRVKIPAKIRRLPLEKAKSLLRTLFDGNVSFGADGASVKAIPCDFGGDQPDKDGCTAAQPIEPGEVFNSTPPIGHFIDEAYGSGKLPKIVLDYYDPAKDRSDDVPKATPKVDCPVTLGNNIRQDFENRILGHYVQYARDMLAKYNCPFTETTKFVSDQTVDPYVTEVQSATIRGDRGYQLHVAAPKVPDLAAAVFHRRLNGRDSFQGANLSRGPLNPGLGDDGKLTVTQGGQKNDICFLVTETSTGQPVPNAQITAYDPSGNDVADLLGRKDVVRTGSDGVGCGTFSIREKGWYRFVYTYYGTNQSNAEGGQRIEAIDRGRTVWSTIEGRSMQCKGDCEQLGFATSRRAHAANVIDDIGNLIRGIVDAVRGIGSKHVDPTGAQQAAQSDGSPSATLYSGQESNGVAPSVFVLKGDLKTTVGVPIVSTSGSGLITNDGGSLVGVKIADLITNDGGSLIAVAVAKAGQPLAKGAQILLITKDGRIISNDGASLITNDGGSLITNDGGSLIAPAAGAVVMVGNRAVIADSGGKLAPGTLVSLGSGGALPVSRLLSENGLG